MKVTIITWDNISYIRDTTQEEINQAEKAGFLEYNNGEMIFNFRIINT